MIGNFALNVGDEIRYLALEQRKREPKPELKDAGVLVVVADARNLLPIRNLQVGDGVVGIVLVSQELAEGPLAGLLVGLEDYALIGDRRGPDGDGRRYFGTRNVSARVPPT